ncbi:MAG: PepSY domain-containing protein [Pseudomonadota bacterium]
MNKTVKRYLFLFHRWFGIAMCLLIALWFATGIIMMYVEYPELMEDERLAMLPLLPAQQVRIDVAAAASRLETQQDDFASIRLSTTLGRPAYQFVTADGGIQTVFADDGSVLHEITPAQAEIAVQDSGFVDHQPESSDEGAQHLATLDIDQWTVSSVLDPHRPLHKVAMKDPAGTIVYVSGVSGQIVRDTTRNERFWNWLGSTIHWIYPWQLRRHADLWANIIIYISLAGIVSVITGGIIGWMRLRIRKPYRGERITPYHGVQKWHHVLGLVSLLFLSTFMFSGLMSMAPWGIFDNTTSAAIPISRYKGGEITDYASYPSVTSLATQSGVKEVEWMQLNGEGYLVLSRSSTDKTVLGSTGELTPADLRTHVEHAVTAMLPESAVASTEVITTYDNYYYSHHNRYWPLPVLRVKFADAEESWFHFDLSSGQALNRLTHTDRVARWLYNGMHSMDFTLLFQHRPIWDAFVIMLCMIGAAFSVTSVWIGWRRLQH